MTKQGLLESSAATVSLTALSLLGTACLSPLAEKGAVSGFLAAAAVGVPLLAAVAGISERISVPFDNGRPGRLGRTALSAVGVAVFWWLAAHCFWDFYSFVRTLLLPVASPVAIGAILLPVAYAAVRRPPSVLYRLALTLLPLTALIGLFFAGTGVALGSDPVADLAQEWSGTAVGFRYCLKVIWPLLLAVPPALRLTGGDARPRTVFLGGAVGTGLLAAVVVTAVCLFGKAAADVAYPFAAAIGTLTVGDLFTRMDGFADFLFYVSSLMQAGLFLAAAATLFERLGLRDRRISAAVLVLCLPAPLLFTAFL